MSAVCAAPRRRPLTDESSTLVSSFPMHLKDQTNPGKMGG